VLVAQVFEAVRDRDTGRGENSPGTALAAQVGQLRIGGVQRHVEPRGEFTLEVGPVEGHQAGVQRVGYRRPDLTDEPRLTQDLRGERSDLTVAAVQQGEPAPAMPVRQ